MKACVCREDPQEKSRISRPSATASRPPAPTSPRAWGGRIEPEAHLRRLGESLAAVDGLAETGGMEHDHPASMGAGPPSRLPNEPGREALSPVAALREHGHQVRSLRGRPAGARLGGHHPHAGGRGGLPGRGLEDEPDEAARPDPGPGPPSVDAVRGLELPRREGGDLLPHPPPMPDKQLEVREGRGTEAVCGHVRAEPEAGQKPSRRQAPPLPGALLPRTFM